MLVIVLAVLVVVIIFTRGDEQTGSAGDASTTASTTAAESDGEGRVVRIDHGDPRQERRVVITIVEDYTCEACAAFAEQYRVVLRSLVTTFDAAVEHVPVAADDDAAALRLANASLCVADDTIEDWMAFRSAMFDLGTVGGGAAMVADQQLVRIAQATGASHSVTACIVENRYAAELEAATARWSSAGVELPHIEINGEPYEPSTPADLSALVRGQ
nr:thioredoxin domain-containing protein [Lolliginicoccus lacisalsi]